MKHPHYEIIRAYADGWKIELNTNGWVIIECPEFNPDGQYRVVPDSDGWLPWYGGECPVDGETPVEVALKDGTTRLVGPANRFEWELADRTKSVARYRRAVITVEMWQWVMRDDATGRIFLSDFTAGEPRCVFALHRAVKVMRAEWTRIELTK